MEPLQLDMFHSLSKSTTVQFYNLSTYSANLMTMIVVLETCLVLHLLLKIMPYNKPQSHEKVYGVV